MPIQTRRTRERTNNPLSPIDLDPWNSNAQLIEERRNQVAPQDEISPFASTLTSLSTSPEEQSEDAMASNSIDLNAPSNGTTPENQGGTNRSSGTNRSTYSRNVSQTPIESIRSIHSPSPSAYMQKNLPPHPTRLSPPRPASAPVFSQDVFGIESSNQNQKFEDIKIQHYPKEKVLTENGSNFHPWKKITKLVLVSSNLMGMLDGSENKPDKRDGLLAYERWRIRDSKVKTQLAMNMVFELYNELDEDDEQSALELWEAVHTRFEHTSMMAQASAGARLRNLIMKNGTSMTDHIKELRKLKGEFSNVGGRLEDQDWLTIIMHSLRKHKEWKHARMNAGNFKTAEEYINYLDIQERGGIGDESDNEESALASNSNSRNNNSNSNRNRNNNKKNDNLVCSNCDRRGHTIEKCYAPGGGDTKNRPSWYKVRGDKDERANVATTSVDDIERQIANLQKQLSEKRGNSGESAKVALTAYIEPVDSDDDRDFALATGRPSQLIGQSWIIDSGATSHMTNDKSNFKTYQAVSPISIETARRGDKIYAIGKGSVLTTMSYQDVECTITLEDVLYVPQLSYNLLSIAKATDRGLEVKMKGNTCLMIKDDKPFAEGIRYDNQWVVKLDVKKEQAYLVSTKASSHQTIDVWHERLGHLNKDRILELVRGGLVTGLSISKQKVDAPCVTCVESKMAATPALPKEFPRADGPCCIIHVDLEFMGHKSISGATISLKFIDELSKYVWVYALKSKDGDTVLEFWTNLVALILTQFSIRVKALHTDNGTEFVNNAMRAFNDKKGIEHHTTVPYRHEMNGLAERMNRTGSDGVRAILRHADLPNKLWAEAYEYWTYVQNRTGRSKVDNKTPYQVLYGKPAAVDHIRAFGSVGYVRVAPELRKKLDPKADKMLLIGYKRDAAFRMYDPLTNFIKYSRDVFWPEPNPSTLHITASEQEAPTSEIDTLSAPAVPELRRSSRLAEKAGADLERVHIARRVIAGIPIPRSIKEVVNSEDPDGWWKAMGYEVDQLEEMKVYDVKERPWDVRVNNGMWVHNVKQLVTGETEKRSRWVARGDQQRPGEYNETFAASGDFVAAKVVVALSSSPDWSLVTLDISSAYLYSPLDETNIFVEYPTGFKVPGFKDPVCHLKKALYGLKQGAYSFSNHLTREFITIDFTRLISAPSVYYHHDAEGETIVATHVDDCTAACRTSRNVREPQAKWFKEKLGSKFKFKEKFPTEQTKLLGMTVYRNEKDGYTKLHVGQKINNILETYKMKDAKPVRTPMVQDFFTRLDDDHTEPPTITPWPYSSLIGELQWIAMVVRVDIAFAVNVLARFLEKPKEIHWEAAKRILAYLAGTKELGVVYWSGGDETPVGFSDSDWAGDRADRKSVSGYVVMLKGGPIQWKSRKQKVVAKSTAEAEYIAASTCVQELIWFRHFFEEIKRDFGSEPIILNVDNQAALQMTKNPVYLSKTKHIDIQVHHIRDEVKQNRVKLQHVDGTSNPADILTKPLAAPSHEKCVKLLGMF